MPIRDRTRGESPAAVWAPAIGSASFEAFCRTFFTLYSPLTVEGRCRLPDEPFLLCSNHCSHADSAALMTASGRRFREFALLGASDYFFRSTRMRWSVSTWMNVIPIERRPSPRSLSTCLTECRRFLSQKGQVLILYPEGTRSLDGELRELKAGVGWLASELRLPIVPAYVGGTIRVLAKGHSIPRPSPVTVRFGEAISYHMLSGRTNSQREQRHILAQQLAWRIRHLMPEHCSREFAADIPGENRHKSELPNGGVSR
jgi:1-acyl-sn-glycerol-3-phosphate acyltransferase